ncbi:MAG: histidine--tRNA ligase [Acidimicrobiia bacterium]
MPDTPRPPNPDAFRAPTGTHDVLSPESSRWSGLIAAFARRAERFGYGLAITPVFEHLEVFRRVGAGTDVVRKEMYTFTDAGERELALRPEGTAPVVRAFVEHRPTPPWKAWYVAPHFRYERPQRGRYRQHHQLGVEAIGVDDPDLDVEVVDLAHGFFTDIGLSDVRLRLNSMGDEESRPAYRAALRSYLLDHADGLGGDFVERVEASPLRVLDSKRSDWREIIERAPQITEYLSDAAQNSFERVQRGLDALAIPYELDPRLVRGFDYYTGTTFEFTVEDLDAAQDAIGGGGRYDRLAEEMGGPAAPGIGFGIGIERLLLAADAQGVVGSRVQRPDAFVVDALGGLEAVRVVHELRSLGLRADRSYGGRSVKAQWRQADRSDARFGVMLGADEASRGAVAVKNLDTGDQTEVDRDEVAAWIETRLETPHDA